jgi:hypothetical protein
METREHSGIRDWRGTTKVLVSAWLGQNPRSPQLFVKQATLEKCTLFLLSFCSTILTYNGDFNLNSLKQASGPQTQKNEIARMKQSEIIKKV